MAYKRISPIPVTEGGTGAKTFTQYGVLTGNGSSAINVTSAGTAGYVLTANSGSAPTWQAVSGGSISITGDTGGALTGSSFTFSGGSTGLSFNGSGSTETLTFTGITANGGDVNLGTDTTSESINLGADSSNTSSKQIIIGNTNYGTSIHQYFGSAASFLVYNGDGCSIEITSNSGGQSIFAVGTPYGIQFNLGVDTCFNVSSIGTVNLPLQPSFLAYCNGQQNNVVGGGANYTVPFNVAITNVQSGYDTSSYTFTAPGTGNYLLTANVLANNLSSSFGLGYITITTSKHTYTLGTTNVGALYAGNALAFSGSVIAPMTYSDTAYVTLNIAGGSTNGGVYGASGTPTTIFSGQLLS